MNDIVQAVMTAKEEILKEKNNKNDDKRAEGKMRSFSPSSLGMCNRAIVYGMAYIPGEPKNYTFTAICDNGTDFHNRFEKYCKSCKCSSNNVC